MKELNTILSAVHPLSVSVLEEVVSSFQHWEYPKNHFLLKQGRVCKHLMFITKGSARHFMIDNEGREMNTWFTLENDIAAEVSSFVKQTPSHESIQLLEDSEMYAIGHDEITQLLQKHHVFALWYIRLIEQFYIGPMEERVTELQFLSAKERYEKLLSRFPTIANRISLGHIASYLKITQETLSRIRSGRL